MKALGCASLPWGKPCFPHEPPSSKARRGLRAAQVSADAAERGVEA